MFENGNIFRSEVLAVEAPQAAPATAIDHVHLRRYTMGDQQLEREVLNLFAGELPKTLASLETATTVLEWKMASHTLKGSARAVGAWRVASAAVAAEQTPAAVHDHKAKAEVVHACAAAVRDAMTYIRGLNAAG